MRLPTRGSPTPFLYSIARFGWSQAPTSLPIRAVLPSGSPSDLDGRCAAVFGGKSERFEYAVTSQRVQADLVPVRDADGSVQFGMLILNRAGHAPPVGPARI